jgi:hypothetical protein
MADPKEGNGGSPKTLFWIFFFLFAGIGAGASFLYKQADLARVALEDAKRDYKEMQQFKQVIAKGKAQSKRLPNAKDSGEDMLPFLEKKRAAAGIDQRIFGVQPLNPIKSPGWKESPCIVTLRGTKESPISRDSVADFLVGIENERPSIKSKTLNFAFLPTSKDLSAASITLSQFQRE